MSHTKIRDLIYEVLETDDRIWYQSSPSDKTLELNYTLLLKLIKDIDEKIIYMLIKENKLKEKFFVKIKSAYVFKSDDFCFFMEENEVDNSYTQYKNKIGLTGGKRFIDESNDVVLEFPYKDCVFTGGQSSEEGMDTYFLYSEKELVYEEKQSERKEIFFNQILASDEVDRLLDEKALVNWKRYTKNGEKIGEETVKEIKRDENGIIKENLIIKGNNLLALHSINKQFADKVKLIYIDPPYNTGKDGFKYNDKFNHSTWLTFMKNRLEVARGLLRDNGVIFISVDDREFAYLKILCDEIFGRENFLNDVIWNSTKSVTNTAIISVSHTHNLVYFKSKDYYVKNRTEFRLVEDGEGFFNPDDDPRGVWKADPFQVGGWRPNQQYEIKNPNTGTIYTPNKGCSWKNDYKKFQELVADNRIVFGAKGTASPQRKRFLFESKKRGKVSKTIWDDAGTTTDGTRHLKQLFNEIVFDNPKPEQFIEKIIELATDEYDIVLDYHLGSGTTASVAHKMGRQYIGIEQMDYIKNIACERLKKVLNGEQGGISKSVNWQGGGDFIYLELAKWNEQAEEQIKACKSLKELEKFFNILYEKYFLNYNVKNKNFQEKILKEENFKKLSLNEQKRIFLEMLDLNQMYVQKTEMADKKFGISKEDQKLTKKFYND